MAKFIIRRLLLMLLTMVMVSIAVFAITEAAPGNIARNVLGIHITLEQEASFLNQNGLDEPIYDRYFRWLAGTDWQAARKVGLSIKQIVTEDGFKEWWAVEQDGTLIRWKMEGEDLIAQRRQPDGSVEEQEDNGRWRVKDPSIEAERLQDYREQLKENTKLAVVDRQAILQELDRILEILHRKDQTQEELLVALTKPEGALESMIDPETARRKGALQEVAEDVAEKESPMQAIAVYQRLSAGLGTLEESELQSMGRQLDGVADMLQGVNPTLAMRLRRASESLKAEDITAARQELEGTVEALDQLTASLTVFVDALQFQDYREAARILRDLSDPAETPLDTARLAILPDVLEPIGKSLEENTPEMGRLLLQAVENLRMGNTEEARDSIGQVADKLDEAARAIARNDAARGARVVRTFWGVDTQNRVVLWEKGGGKKIWKQIWGQRGWQVLSGGPMEYIPLQKGLLRGDPGLSLRTGRPVADLLFTRLRNSLVLAGIAFTIVMPLALVLGLIAGLNEGKPLDRVLSIGGMIFSVMPEFATGIFLILIFAFWLELVPGATVFGKQAPWKRPEMLILPVLTLTLIELGYVLRITRASMAEVMKAPYIRTAFLKGLPYRRIVIKHALRNALMAPITVIMLHVNWLLGGIVIVEVIFGYPGLGSYLLEAALFKDFNAIEAGAIVLVAVAVGTQLLADITYTFLNPRIRYA
jgi:ABC-type dipeptide/oligopeptide/nickel transport system permease component